MSGFNNWRVAVMTPSRVDTPYGAISVSWRCNTDDGELDRRAEAAARLIAAAPELLAVARYAVDNPDFDSAELDRMARAAIAKATGGEQ